MKNYGITRSTVRPKEKEITEKKVFVATNIKEVQVTDPETEEVRTEFEYDLKEFEKDEYIHSLDTQVTDTQMALVEVYELMI